MNFTIDDLKKNLGPGLGLRKSKYLLEIPVPSQNGKKINLLCQSTSLPERNISTVTTWHRGRKYMMRGETTFTSTYNISVLDDSEMSLRELFDGWLTLVDNTNPDASLLTNSFNNFQTSYEDDSSANWQLKPVNSIAGETIYQADINVWQLSQRSEKIYGYKLQNAFPSSIGTVELDDSDNSTLSQFSLVFTYSELIPIKGTGSKVGNIVNSPNIF